MIQRQRNAAFVAVLVLLAVVVAACIEDLRLDSCSEEEGGCKEGMVCRKGRCFHWVPPWEVPPCSSPVAKGRCCDMEQTVIPDNGDCRLPLLEGADAISAPSLGPDGTVVVAVREGTKLSVIAVRPNGSEAWREIVDNAHTGVPSIVRVADDGRAFMDQGDVLWTRSPEGAVSTMTVDGTIDGGFAVCAGVVAVALVRGTDKRGVVRLGELGEDVGDWQLDYSLDILPTLPPAISVPDDAVATAWSDGTVVIYDLSTGKASEPWSNLHTEAGITGLAADGEGHLWVSTANGTIERLSMQAGSRKDLMSTHLRVELGTGVHTPPVLPWGNAVVIGLDDGWVVQGDEANNTDPIPLKKLVTKAPGALTLLEGEGFQLLGDCPEGRCLSIFYGDSTSYFGEVFEYKGEHRHSWLPAEAAVGLPGPEGLAALVSNGSLEGHLVAGPTRDAPWPGPDGGSGNGRCVEEWR